MTDKIPDTREPARIAEERAAFPSLYCALWPDLVAIARQHGYALLIHGSLRRDLDVVAVPWVEDAAASEVLVEALRAKTDAWIGCAEIGGGATIKPHGRRGYVLMLGGHAYVDLGVMPRAAEHAALVALLGEVSDALTFYADPESYRRQPGVVGSMGGWVPGDIPPEKRDEWLRESWARALNHDDSDASWRQEIDADTPGAVKHTIHEAGFMDHPPVITDSGRKAAANKARIDAALAGLGGA